MRELQSRRRVKTLRIKHALPLAALKPRRLAEQLCTQWHTAAANNRQHPARPFYRETTPHGNPRPYTANQNRRNTGTIRTILPIP